jgi:hypothetical protein
MRKVSWAILAWTGLGLVAAWFRDDASHSGGRLGQLGELIPAWVAFELWAIGFMILASPWIRASATSSSASIGLRPTRRLASAVVAWTVVWVVLVGIWALDPAGQLPARARSAPPGRERGRPDLGDGDPVAHR